MIEVSSNQTYPISFTSTNLSNVLVSGDFNLNGTTGDVIFDTFDAKNIYVKVIEVISNYDFSRS